MIPTGPTIRPTRPLHLLLALAGSLLVLRLVWSWWQGQGGSLPLPGVAGWASLAILAAGVGWLAVTTRRTLARDRAALDPQQAVTRLLLGKTSQLGAAVLLGAHGSLLWAAAGGLPAPLAVERIVHSGIAALAAIAWWWAGRSLEAACRLPDDPGDDGDDTGVPDPDAGA